MNLHTVGVKVVKEMRERTAWIDNLYKDEADIKEYYNNLKVQIISILNK